MVKFFVERSFYLIPADGRKSFYGKCHVDVFGDEATLYSYNTPICTYNTKTGELVKHEAWNYSMTTKRHQKAFLKHYGITA